MLSILHKSSTNLLSFDCQKKTFGRFSFFLDTFCDTQISKWGGAVGRLFNTPTSHCRNKSRKTKRERERQEQKNKERERERERGSITEFVAMWVFERLRRNQNSWDGGKSVWEQLCCLCCRRSWSKRLPIYESPLLWFLPGWLHFDDHINLINSIFQNRQKSTLDDSLAYEVSLKYSQILQVHWSFMVPLQCLYICFRFSGFSLVCKPIVLSPANVRFLC